METILVFGINGFIGKHLRRFIVENGIDSEYAVIGADVRFDPDGAGNVAEISCDCSDGDVVRRLIGRYRPEYVINLIGRFSSAAFESLYEVNVGVTKTILDAYISARIRAKKILLIGSAAEYGIDKSNPIPESEPPSPVTSYGTTKFIQSCLAAYYSTHYATPVVVARTFNLYGEGASPELSIGNFERQISAARDGDAIMVGDLANRRDFLRVDKAVSHFWTLLLHGLPGEIYNVCSGYSRPVGEILHAMIAASGKRLEVRRDPSFRKQGDLPDIFGDPSKLNGLIVPGGQG